MNSEPAQSDDLEAALCTKLGAQESEKIARALAIPIAHKTDGPARPEGARVARILKDLGADSATLTAAILSDSRLRETLQPEFLTREFGETIANLVRNVNWLNTLNVYSIDIGEKQDQAEILRRMLLAMVDDVRAVLIKLATRLERLRILPGEDYDVRIYIARETLDIYSPLANRLGIAQLKWELEDLAFRYLQPQVYKRIARSLAENRTGRESYLSAFVERLNQLLEQENVEAQVYGRPKHIYSIWKKMQRKQVEFSDVFDLRAVRIVVDQLTTCYTVLGLIHGTWQYVPEEFDDYIANPKANGYQSLHTVVIGPEGAMVEIQIRTRAMHEFAELGVAAHWRYKEGGKQDSAVEKSVESLRRLLEHKDDDRGLLEDFRANIYTDRIFVLTPGGDLKDLPRGSTPLDFAYAIHTEVGHRCRGAKVDGRIVPLTYPLKSGEQVEILTIKSGAPSRNWLEPHLGYLKTPHARSKIRHWFRKQDHDRHLQDGKAILEREKSLAGLNDLDRERLVRHFHLSRFEELLINLGRSDISPAQLADALLEKPRQETTRRKTGRKPPPSAQDDSLSIQGVDNLLSSIAQCCKPVPGDAIVGFISLGKGIVIHKQDCRNILNLPFEKQDRLIDVNWGTKTSAFTADIYIQAFDRQNLLRDITQVLSNEKINIQESTTRIDPGDGTVTVRMSLQVNTNAQLSRALDKIGQLRNILEIRRDNP